jgi:hypothetical protein
MLAIVPGRTKPPSAMRQSCTRAHKAIKASIVFVKVLSVVSYVLLSGVEGAVTLFEFSCKQKPFCDFPG